MIKASYILYDLAGYPYNGKYPPKCKNDKEQLYHGYEKPVQECLFYDFAVLGYDLKIVYRGQDYYFMVDEDCIWLSDSKFCAQFQRFEHGNDVLENFKIDGVPLIELMEQLDEFEPF